MHITRRRFVAGMSAASIAAAGFGGLLLHSQKRRNRPNVMVFITDDMRYDAAGFAGNAIIKTPHLDELAHQGTVFDNNFVTTSVCPISRASIMSGHYALRHGVYDFEQNMRRESFRNSFPILMRRSGYHTGFIGKWGMGGFQPKRLFDDWYGFEGHGQYYNKKGQHLTDVQTMQALRFLKDAPSRQPFLLVLCYKAPHAPLKPHPRYDELYDKDDIPRVKTDMAKAGRSLQPLIKHSLDREDYFNFHFDDEEKYQQNMKKYYRLITGVDDSVGAILKQLALDKRMDDTSIVFTSDNGMLLGDHGLNGKWCMYEESIRTPMVIRPAPSYFPKVKASRQLAMSLNIDICPTLLEMASLEAPRGIQGKSLLPLITAAHTPTGEEWRDGFYYEHPHWPQLNVLACEGYRGLEWKYSRYRQGNAWEECLFNLAADPAESNNLAKSPDYAAVMRHMRHVTAIRKKALQEA